MRELLSLLRRRDVQGLFRRPTTNAMVQFFRYAFVGGFAALVDWAVVWLVERLGAHYQVGVVCGFFAGLTVNYLLSKWLVFQVEKARTGAGGEFLGYALIGAVGLLLDLVVILLGWPVFGDVDAVLYGVLSTAVSSIVIDKILYGMDAGKLLVIITTKGRQVASRIAAESGRCSTMLRAAGSYTGTARQVLLCACSKSQAFRVRACVYEVDAAAFVMIAETSEVYGEGFRPAGG